VFHIHIPRHAAPAAPERLLGASAGETGAFFAADGALFALHRRLAKLTFDVFSFQG
jgi:hypothetical protein